MFQSNSRNTIVLNGTNNFSSLRIEDPKKANVENDVYFKIMTNQIPQVTQYFNIVNKLGEGTFSRVYKAKLKRQYLTDGKDESEEYALKYLLPIVKPARMAQELRYLRDLGGNSNIIPIKTCFYKNGHIVIVMPIIEHDRFTDYFQSMTVDEIRDYMRKLLIALERVHSRGIVHRDIKPSNFLYNRLTGRCALVDFGLSQSERELQYTINSTLYPSKMLPKLTNDSKARKNLENKFNTPNPQESKQTQQKFNNIASNNKRELETDKNENSAIKRFKTSSVFISPVTPQTNNQQAATNVTFIPETPVKSRQPLAEESINIPATPIKNNFAFETPKKTTPLPFDAKKTPVKCALSVPETPPKSVPTVQKNLHFNRNPSTNIKGNCKENLTTPKFVLPSSYRLQINKRALDQELSELSTTDRTPSNKPARCECIEKPAVVDCLSKPELNVPRAGTPGFRAPEILMRCHRQSTKIDIWSSGVIFASLLSGRYPFFRCADDLTCLAEIMTVIGATKVKKAAAALGKTLVVAPTKTDMPHDLKAICVKLKSSSTKSEKGIEFHEAPDEAYDLLKKLLDPNPNDRISATDALKHPFFFPSTLDKSIQS